MKNVKSRGKYLTNCNNSTTKHPGTPNAVNFAQHGIVIPKNNYLSIVGTFVPPSPRYTLSELLYTKTPK